MGRGFATYHLTASNLEECVLLSAFLDYRLADGTKLHVLQQPASCPTCRRFVLAEEVPSMEALEEELTKYRSGDAGTLETWKFIANGAPVETRIAELVRRIEWRHARASPARCLECGGFGLISIPLDGEFAHSHTGEKVRVVDSGWADAAPWIGEFSPEGEFLSGPGSVSNVESN